MRQAEFRIFLRAAKFSVHLPHRETGSS